MVLDATVLRRENEALQKEIDNLEAIKKMCDEMGVDPANWGSPREARRMLIGNFEMMDTMLRRLKKDVESAFVRLEKIKEQEIEDATKRQQTLHL